MPWDQEGYTRDDGLKIGQEVDSGWTVFSGDVTIRYCPCCHKRMNNERAARMVADVIFPERTPSNDDSAG